MTKKPLLTEAVVHRFMTLAGPQVLNHFTSVKEAHYTTPLKEDEEDMAPPAIGGDDMPEDDGLDAEEPDAEAPVEGMSEEAVYEIVAAVADVLAAKTGTKIDVQQGGGGEEAPELPGADEPALDAPLGDEAAPELEAEIPGDVEVPGDMPVDATAAPVDGEVDAAAPSGLAPEDFDKVVSAVVDKLIAVLTGLKGDEAPVDSIEAPTDAPVAVESKKVPGRPALGKPTAPAKKK